MVKSIGKKSYLVTAVVVTIPMVIYIWKSIEGGFAGMTLVAAGCWTIASIIWWTLYFKSRMQD